MAFGSFVRGALKATVKGLKGGLPKLIKGVKGSGGTLVKGLKRGFKGAQGVGQSLINRTTNLFKATPKPKGVVKETVIKRGKDISKQPIIKPFFTKGKFDESLIKIKPIKEIPKKKFVRQGLKKAQRLELAKAVLKTGKPVKNLF